MKIIPALFIFSLISLNIASKDVFWNSHTFTPDSQTFLDDGYSQTPTFVKADEVKKVQEQKVELPAAPSKKLVLAKKVTEKAKTEKVEKKSLKVKKDESLSEKVSNLIDELEGDKPVISNAGGSDKNSPLKNLWGSVKKLIESGKGKEDPEVVAKISELKSMVSVFVLKIS